MKATLSAHEALRRINAELDSATRRLAELNKEATTPRTAVAIEQIQQALKNTDTTRRMVSRIAMAAMVTGPEAIFELSDGDISLLTFGVEIQT